MTFQIFKKNDKWYRSYAELKDSKYDDTMFVELPDTIVSTIGRLDMPLAEILTWAERGRAFVGMHGLTEHSPLYS